MKLHESDNRGGIAVKMYTKSTCSQYDDHFHAAVASICSSFCIRLSVSLYGGSLGEKDMVVE